MIRWLAVLVRVAAGCGRLMVRVSNITPVIGHRTKESAQRPGGQREQSDGAMEATDGLGSMRGQGSHDCIIRVRRWQVKAAPRIAVGLWRTRSDMCHALHY